MRRTLLVVPVLAAALAFPASASAHPLGNFSVNHLTQVAVSADRVSLRYVLDQAEIPTFQQRGATDAQRLARVRAELRQLVVLVDGRRVALRPDGRARLSRSPGEGGLETTRVEVPLAAPVASPRRVVVRDGTYPGRVGWKAIVARPGRGTAVRSSVPSADPTRGLRVYSEALPDRPVDVRSARFDVRPGAGTLSAPDGERVVGGLVGGGAHGFAGLLGDAASGRGVLLLLLLAAFGWGAAHALSPGHGKAMVAAYLVGTRGTPRQAVALGAIVTATHTAGVFALGTVTLLLAGHVLPETLYPWLTLLSGLMVVAIGVAVLRGNLRRVRGRGGHERGAGHAHPHGAGHAHPHGAGHAHPPHRPDRRGLVAMGAAAGLIPCPSALVVLLGAIAQDQIALGMLLIVAFSAGLAATLTALGLVVVLATRSARRLPAPGRLVAALPVASAVVIVAVGCVLTARALPLVGA